MESIKQFNQNVEIGNFFENMFLSLLNKLGFKSEEDYQDLRYIGLRQSMPCGYPDFYFPKSRTFIEIKSINKHYSSDQKIQFKKLKKEGYKIITIHFQMSIIDTIEDIKKLNQFILDLKGC